MFQFQIAILLDWHPSMSSRVSSILGIYILTLTSQVVFAFGLSSTIAQTVTKQTTNDLKRLTFIYKESTSFVFKMVAARRQPTNLRKRSAGWPAIDFGRMIPPMSFTKLPRLLDSLNHIIIIHHYSSHLYVQPKFFLPVWHA